MSLDNRLINSGFDYKEGPGPNDCRSLTGSVYLFFACQILVYFVRYMVRTVCATNLQCVTKVNARNNISLAGMHNK